MKKRQLGILVFDDVEVLDFAGPFEVFAVTDELNQHTLLDVYLVSESSGPVTAKNGFTVVPDKLTTDIKKLDILLIPGGAGARIILNNNNLLNWIRETSTNCELVLSVCTGALVLGKAGLLEGLSVTTHHGAVSELEQQLSNAEIILNERYIDNGKVVTSAGISAGIDMSFHIVERLFGKEVSVKTAEYMEYRAENRD